MIDLQAAYSLPIQFSVSDGTFSFNDMLFCRCKHRVPLANLIPALLNKALKYPEEVYDEHEDIYLYEDQGKFEKNGLHHEIVILPPGLLGIEFIKSHIYYAPETDKKYSCMVECLFGTVTVLIQKNAPKDEYDFETSIKEGIMIKVRQGEQIAIPSGYFYTFINTRNSPVVFSRVSKNKGIVDYSLLKNEQGLGYFAIRKNARTEIVFNPRYRDIPKLVKFTPSSERFKVEYAEKPLYQSMKENLNYFIDSLLQF